MKPVFPVRSLCACLLILSASLPAAYAGTPPEDSLLRSLFRQHPLIARALFSDTPRTIQLIFTQVNRGANGIPALRHHYWEVDSNRYFYPGNAVKLPLGLLTLQRLGGLKQLGVDRATTMLTEKARPSQTAVYNDPQSPDGRPTPGLYLRRMMAGDDQDAGNRLYELLGQQYIHRELQARGYGHARIVQRLGMYLSDEDNRCTNPVRLLAPGNRELFRQPQQCNTDVYPARRDSLGKAYYSNGKLFSSPLNCSGKNRATLQQLHQMLISLVFPSKVTSAGRFNLSDDDRHFLLRCMSAWPEEIGYPPYADDPVTYFPARNKYLLLGGQPGPAPDGLRIFNVTGMGYGQITDVAYIVDFDKKIEFFLSVVVDCARDGILHTDTYEYQSAGLPLLKELGQALYQYEAARERAWLPDLGEFRFSYEHD